MLMCRAVCTRVPNAGVWLGLAGGSRARSALLGGGWGAVPASRYSGQEEGMLLVPGAPLFLGALGQGPHDPARRLRSPGRGVSILRPRKELSKVPTQAGLGSPLAWTPHAHT